MSIIFMICKITNTRSTRKHLFCGINIIIFKYYIGCLFYVISKVCVTNLFSIDYRAVIQKLLVIHTSIRNIREHFREILKITVLYDTENNYLNRALQGLSDKPKRLQIEFHLGVSISTNTEKF